MAISLASISNNPTIAPPRVVLYGPHGVGKTTFGAGAPSPIFLPVEEGLGTLSVNHFPLLSSYTEVMEAIGALYQEDHKFETVVIDSADWLEPLVWTETCKKHSKDDIEAFGYGKGYLHALDQWRELLGGLNALRSERGMAIVFLAHTTIKRFDAPDEEPYDRYQIKLHDRASALLEEWADAVLFANFKVFTKKTDVGFNKSVTRGVGQGERLLYTEERPAYKAKNRYALPPELPLAWDAFEQALAAPAAAPTDEAA